MIKKELLRIVLVGVGITSLASLVYFAGPLISFGGWHPLNNYIVREMCVVLLVAGAASLGGFHFIKRKRNAKALADGVSEAEKKESDEAVLKDKMKDALTTLKSASGGRKDYLYDLPWYLLIGPPGSGKTTALINSGLKFPLSRGASPAAIAGVGGTRYCDWWFTEDAVLIDTAGRYTTQDSDAKIDKESWFAFLDLLKRNRPRQPINGVILAISVEDLLTLPAVELAAHSQAVRARLLELHERLKVNFPVYALFTKADLVAGFMEFFGNLNDQGRRQVWGATFQTADKTRNMIGEVPVEYNILLERLSDETLDRLQDEPAPDTRVLLFGFPAQMARLRQSIHDFLTQIFEPTRYHANAMLRGFYFTSGTQQGTPIDQLIGALVKSFGAEQVSESIYSGQGKSFFLHDLILKVIIGEAAWVSSDRAAIRRAMMLKAAALSIIVLVVVGASAAWFTSFRRNSTLIEQTELADKEYTADAGPYLHEAIVGDRALHKVLPLLHELRYMPAGYANREEATPLAATFGLSQRARLQSASENSYRLGLERMLRPRLIYRLEEQMEAKMSDPAFIYDALKVYLMLGGQQPAERNLIVAWMRQDWAENLYPGGGNADGRKELEEHLIAMLDLENGEPLIELNGRLIEDSQKTLARLSVAQRAYALLKSQARSSSSADWSPAQKGGPDVGIVFESIDGRSLDNIRVPEFFTYSGFHDEFLGRLADIADRIKRERWVLGTAGDQTAISTQYDNLADALLELYSADFISAWKDALGKIRLRKLTEDKPRYLVLSAISAPTSPLRQLLVSIKEETSLTRERAASPQAAATKDGGQLRANKPVAQPLTVLFKSQDHGPGENIETAFRQFHVVLEGEPTRQPLDAVIANLNQIAQNMILAATNPSQAPQANIALQNEVAGLRNNAARLPQPFDQMLAQAAAEFEKDVATTKAGQLMIMLRDQIYPVCKQTIGGRYPFVKGSRTDVPLADFAKLFSPNGLMDRFFTQNLAPYADTSKPQWTWRQNSNVDPSLSPTTLKEFQLAAEIRDAYFQTGGNAPTISLAIKPPTLSAPGASAKFETAGVEVASLPSGASDGAGFFNRPPPAAANTAQTSSNSPVVVQWPGPSQRTAISVTNDTSSPPSVLERTGPWSMFRMLEAGSLSLHAEMAVASFIVGGQELRYNISSGSLRNPLDMAVLREFQCPGGI
jgi:type VI secretion system protein ImpL